MGDNFTQHDGLILKNEVCPARRKRLVVATRHQTSLVIGLESALTS